MFKKRISIFLMIVMLMQFVPAITPQAIAAADDIGSMNALDALGIDTSVMPEGYDPNSTDNPYGRNTVTVNPVYELFVTGVNMTGTSSSTETVGGVTTNVTTKIFSLENTLFGNNKPLNQSMGNFYDQGTKITQEAYREIIRNPGTTEIQTTKITLAATASASGNFIGGSTAGKSGQVVTVGAGSLSKNGGLYLYFTDPLTGNMSGMKELIAATATIGNSGNQMEENFVESPYLMQNYLKVATGDFDNNGIDEVAVYVAEQGKSRVEIYKLETTSSYTANFYLTENNWKKAWTHYFYESPYVSNMVSLTSGDFNRDGTDDIAMTWGYYYGTDKHNPGQAVILYGSNKNMLQEQRNIVLSYNTSSIVRAAFTYGDIDGDNVDDLILGGQLATDIAGGNLNTRFIAVFNYNGNNDRFFMSVAKNFDLFEKKDNNYVHAAMAGSGDKYYSSPASITNIASVNMNGVGRAAFIYIDSLLIEYDDQGLVIKMALDQNASFNKKINSTQKYYIEYGIVAADFTGDAKETLQVMQYYLPAVQYTNVTIPLYMFWWYRYITVTVSETLPGELDMMGIFGSGDTIAVRRTTNLGFSTSFCKLNSDEDTVLLKYKNIHYVTYSDPKVLAVLASAPYFADLDNDELSGNYMESETSYSSSTGSGSGSSTSHTLNVGAYISFEKDFEVFGVKVAKMEAELAYSRGWTWETAKSSMIEQTITYATLAGSDAVAFYSIPMETYVYESLVPVINSSGSVVGYDVQNMSVNIPHTASVKVLPLETYEKIAADYAELPQISGRILNHTVGDPASYPSSKAGFNKAIEYGGNWSGVNFGVGSITQEITMTSETEKSYTTTNTIETKIGAGPGNFVFGVSAGYERGSSQVTVTTSGSSFKGQLFNMPKEAEQYHYGYSWKVFSYLYSSGGTSFPVVSYLVRDVSAPPKLPTDFEQDSSGTTHDRIKLTWSYTGAASGFQLYRYYLFPDGGGSYELAFVPASDAVDADINTGTRYYEYIDTGLDPYSVYDYQIQVIGASVPTDSILSPIYTARTKTDQGYPSITLSGVVDDKLLVYPDTEKTVEIIINNRSDYTQTPRYQWQKLTENGWTNIIGATGDKYTFKSAGIADEGQYRCRVNAIYQSYYISAYSSTFTLEYSKRTPIVVADSFKVIDVVSDGSTLPKISLSLKSAHPNHHYVPSGNVTFAVTGSDYSRSFSVALVPSGVSGEANAAVVLESPLPAGAYEIAAYYSGSRVYKSLTTDNAVTYLSGSGSGYVLTLNSSYTYGSAISPILRSVHKTGGVTTTSTVAGGISYKVYEHGYRWEPVYFYKIIIWYKPVHYKFENDSMIKDGAVSAAKAGNFTLAALIDGQEVVRKDFSVVKKQITIGIQNLTAVAGTNLVHPTSSILELINGSALAYNEQISDLGLAVKATNTAGSEVTISSSTNPGYYTIVGTAGATAGTKYSNYAITFVPGKYILTGPQYPVTAVANQLIGKTVGTVELLKPDDNVTWTFTNGTTLVFQAKPYTGYDVRGWTVKDNSTGNVVATGTGMTFSHLMKSEPITVSVDFEVAQKTLRYQAVAGTGTLVCTSSSVMYSGSVAAKGAEFTFKATPSPGYHFVAWQLTEIGKSPMAPAGTANPDGSNTCSITMGTGNTILYAIFARNSYHLTLQGDLQASYYDDTDNNITTPDVLVTVSSGAMIMGDKIVTVNPKPGYSVENGAAWKEDGVAVTEGVSGDNQSYTFRMLKNTEVAVKTQNERYGITLQVEGPGNTVNAVSVAVNGGTVSNLNNIAGGSSVVFNATPAYGYAFDKWIINGSEDKTSGAKLTIAALGSSLNVKAVFKNNTSYTISVNHGLRGSVSYTQNGGAVTNISPGGVISVFKGDNVTLTAKPDTNFMVENWKIDGIVKLTTVKTQTLTNISANINVEVVFGAQSYSTVTYSVYGTGGSITSAKTDGVPFESGNNSIGNGSTLEFKVTPGTGMMVNQWKYNGITVMNGFNKKLVDTTFIIPVLSGNANVEVSFRAISTHLVTVSDDIYTTTTSNYFPEIGGGVRDGATAVFTVTPDDGYRISSVSVSNTGAEEGFEFDSLTKEADGRWICVVGAITGDITVTAKASKLYTVTVPSAPTGGSIALNLNNATENQLIILTATPASGNYEFSGWTVVLKDTDESVALAKLTDLSASFNMPASDVTVSAAFTYKGGGGGDSGGGGGGGGGIPPILEIDGKIFFNLTDGTSSISSDLNKQVIELNQEQEIIVTGNGLRIVIPAGLTKPGDDLNDLIPNKLTDSGGPGHVVVYTDADGKRHIIQWSVADKDGVSFIAEGRGKYEIIDNRKTFDDISGHWGTDAIQFVTARELFMGTGSNEFSADANMTRAMLVTVLHRLDGLKSGEGYSFTDVNDNQWYSGAVVWAASNNIVGGYGNGNFGTNDNITREQLATILFRYARFINANTQATGNLSRFADAGSVSGYAQEAMKWAAQTGLISGRPGGILDPAGNATRAELATVLKRFVEMVL